MSGWEGCQGIAGDSVSPGELSGWLALCIVSRVPAPSFTKFVGILVSQSVSLSSLLTALQSGAG